MVFKLATAVMFFLTVGSAAFADNPPPVTSCGDFPSKALDAFSNYTNYSGSDSTKKQQLKDIADKAQAMADKYCGNGNSSSGDCSSAGQDFSAAFRDMQSTCALPDGNCEAFAQCSAEDKAGINPSSKTAVDDARKTCSALASSDLGKLQDQLAKDKDHLSTLKDKADDNAKDASSGMKDTTKDINELRDKMAKDQKESADKITEISKQSAADIKELAQSIAVIQNQIDELNGALNQQIIAQQTAYDNLENQKAQVRLSCQNSASQQVANLQAQVLAQMKMGAYNRGSFTNLAQSVGVSDRLAWQRVANKYYSYCMASAATNEAFDGGNRAYRTAVLTVQKTRDSINLKINRAKAQILQKDNGLGCGTMGPQTEKCADLMQAQQQIQAESASLQATNQATAQSAAALQQQGMQDMMQKQQASQGSQQEYNDEKKRTDNLQALINAKLEAGGSTDVDSKELSKSRGKFELAKEDAQKLTDCAKNKLITDAACTQQPCKAAADFLTRIKNQQYGNSNRYDTSDPSYSAGGSGGGTTPRAPASDTTPAQGGRD